MRVRKFETRPNPVQQHTMRWNVDWKIICVSTSRIYILNERAVYQAICLFYYPRFWSAREISLNSKTQAQNHLYAFICKYISTWRIYKNIYRWEYCVYEPVRLKRTAGGIVHVYIFKLFPEGIASAVLEQRFLFPIQRRRTKVRWSRWELEKKKKTRESECLNDL